MKTNELGQGDRLLNKGKQLNQMEEEVLVEEAVEGGRYGKNKLQVNSKNGS